MDFSVKYGARAFRFTVVVNTDEDLDVLCERLEKAVQGEKLNATIIGVYKVEPSELATMFAAAKETMRGQY